MHRTQLLLENWQYDAVKMRARREGKSLSEWVRDLLRSTLAPASALASAKKAKGIDAICGILSDPEGPSAADHDRILYGWDKKK